MFLNRLLQKLYYCGTDILPVQDLHFWIGIHSWIVWYTIVRTIDPKRSNLIATLLKLWWKQ
ncbi:hypothetical protein QUB00_00730 [Microcoleus sp. F8_C2]